MPINVHTSAYMTPPCCKGDMVTLRASSNGTRWGWFNTTLVYNTHYLPMSRNSCPITHHLFRLWHSCHVTHTTYSCHSIHVYNTHHLFMFITHIPTHVIAFMYITTPPIRVYNTHTYSCHSIHIYNIHHLFTFITHTPIHVIAFTYITHITYSRL